MTEFFPDVQPIRYEGPDAQNDLAYRYYDPDRIVLGKRMEEQLRIAVCYWHSFNWPGRRLRRRARSTAPGSIGRWTRWRPPA
jgi:xylose isomerase